MDWYEFLERVTANVADNQAATLVRQELHGHLTMLTQDLEAQGFSSEEARKEAVLRMGSPEEIRDSFSFSQSQPFSNDERPRGIRQWFVTNLKPICCGATIGIGASFLPFTWMSGIAHGRTMSFLLLTGLVCAFLFGVGEPIWLQVRSQRINRGAGIGTSHPLWLGFVLALVVGAFIAKYLFWYLSGLAQLLTEFIFISALMYSVSIASSIAITYWRKMKHISVKA